ncbi:hypothetical protein Acr_06g0010090 [Actinidia rufa]|uniref:CCHC-type domain-containing protein n=1 Tax=Actinidia rufa TaxID=165716 RepID=A0A7J0ESU0_9ERIC|nr:hypothetical protein Acr_06g0010090 [Actinidia rufa]
MRPRARRRSHAPVRAQKKLSRSQGGCHAPSTGKEERPRAAYALEDLHDPLKNKGDKPVVMKDEEWRKMNRKTIGLIRHCIRHEVFYHVAEEMSVYELWIKLEEMYQAKINISKQSLIDKEACEFEASERDYSGRTYERVPEFVVSLSNSAPNEKLTTSMVMDVLFNEEARRREMSTTDQSESQALVLEGSSERGRGKGRGHHKGTKKGQWRSQARGCTIRCFYCDQEGHIKKDCPKYKAHDQSSDTVATVVMADDDESDVLLAASKDRKSNWHARDMYGWQTTQLAELLAEDSKGCSFDVSGGTIRVSKGNKEILWEKKTEGLYRLERSVQTGGATVRYESNGISKKNGQEMQPLYRAQGDALRYVHKSSQTRVMQPVQDIHREAQWNETKSILRNCTAKGMAKLKQVSFALNLISDSDLSSCAHKGGDMEP